MRGTIEKLTVQKSVKQLHQLKRIFLTLMAKLNKFFLLFFILFLLSAYCFNVKNDLLGLSTFHLQKSDCSSLCIPIHAAPLLCTIDTECLKNISSIVSFSKIKAAFYLLIVPCILNFFQSLILIFISLFSSLRYKNKFLLIVSFIETLF